MIKYLIKLLPLLISLLLLGCEEEIVLPLKSVKQQLVVNGILTTDTTYHQVRLSLSGNYFDNQPQQSVSGATVSLSDGTSTIQLTENPEGSGNYYTPGDYYGKENTLYTLTIEDVKIDGIDENTVYTASSRLPNIIKPDSVGIDYDNNWDLWKIMLYAQDPEETNFYLFKVLKNDSLISDTYDKVTIINDRYYDGNYADGVWIFGLDPEETEENLIPGDVITLECYSTDEQLYDYINGLQIELAGSNPLFSGNPANIPGNISNGAWGIFSACGVYRVKTVNTQTLEEMKNKD
ncbi:DUF4249 domain-containing protein [Geofilum sp. OHC36d9]|uniref:DUF4249 domain-containing protein n=1 Tax=Geofilum sp. OHC36d9 TaxID=3458413 RepID=UPI0040332ED6